MTSTSTNKDGPNYTVRAQVGTVSILCEMPATYPGKGLTFRRHTLYAPISFARDQGDGGVNVLILSTESSMRLDKTRYHLRAA
jgi:hypothetical protein